MSSDLYEVSARGVENDTTMVLDLKVVHPDVTTIPATPGFALMLLFEPAEQGDPIATELDHDSVLDSAWMRRYARGFVRDVEVVELANEPPAAAKNDDEHPYWKEPDRWLRGTIRFEVSDPAWISHLSTGQSWGSTAFESNRSFEECDPIRFEPAETPSTATDARFAGLMPVPPVMFPDLLGSLESEFAWIPKYTEKAYVTDETYEGDAITEEVLDSLVGKVVRYSNHGDHLGVLTPDHRVARISKRSRGAGDVFPGVGTIGAARFDTNKKRLAEPLPFSKLIRHASDAAVAKARIDGTSVSLTVYCFGDRTKLNIKRPEPNLKHEGDALALLGAPECERRRAFAQATSKLGTMLHDKAQEHGINLRHPPSIYKTFAMGVITDYSVQKTKDTEPVDVDALSDDEAMARLAEAPWETWTIDITVTDTAWIEHLPAMTPFGYFGSTAPYVGEPKPWDEEPLTYGE